MTETQKETLKIIALDSWVELPTFDIEHDITVITDGSASTKPEQLNQADIIINSQVPIDHRLLEHMPKLRLIASTGTGTDHIEKKAVAERGVTLCNVPAQNTDAVAEHAFALASALKRRILPMHQMTVEGKQWAEKRAGHLAFGLPPRTNGEETLVRYGALGRKIEQIGAALGMKIRIVERKNAPSVRPGRISFSDALRQGTLFITVVPRNEDTHDMFAAPELEAMDSTAVLVNVGRGGVVNEEAVAKGLRDGQIGGFATDVFAVEPATRQTSVLLDETIPNLILSPHIAWYSSRTLQGTKDVLKGNVEGFLLGKAQNVVV